jgi:hypothetical protein
MTSRTRLRRLPAAACAAAAALGALTTAPSASAATIAHSTPAATAAPTTLTTNAHGQAVPLATLCPSGWFCVWHGAPRSGGWIGGNQHNLCHTPFNNNGNAVSNQTGTTIRVWSATGCHGSYFDLPTGHYSYPTPFTVRSVTTF